MAVAAIEPGRVHPLSICCCNSSAIKPSLRQQTIIPLLFFLDAVLSIGIDNLKTQQASISMHFPNTTDYCSTKCNVPTSYWTAGAYIYMHACKALLACLDMTFVAFLYLYIQSLYTYKKCKEFQLYQVCFYAAGLFFGGVAAGSNRNMIDIVNL